MSEDQKTDTIKSLRKDIDTLTAQVSELQQTILNTARQIGLPDSVLPKNLVK